jgi:ubiquinone/menaquinone biosynthesis C-methylase UbiE
LLVGQVLDCGCGVGGPGRNIAAFTGAKVTGITLNEYQVQRGNELAQAQGLQHLYRSVQGDFMKLPFEVFLSRAGRFGEECSAVSDAVFWGP